MADTNNTPESEDGSNKIPSGMGVFTLKKDLAAMDIVGAMDERISQLKATIMTLMCAKGSESTIEVEEDMLVLYERTLTEIGELSDKLHADYKFMPRKNLSESSREVA